MKNIKNLLSVLVIFATLFAGCKEKEDIKENSTSVTVYNVSDLKGIWSGNCRIIFSGGSRDGQDTTATMTFEFAADGSLVEWVGPPIETKIGKLNVNEAGVISGNITTTHKTGSTNIETTNMNWAGCNFLSKTKIKTNMRWTWTNTGSTNGGGYLISGDLNKQ